jgi:hypothetical protein
MVKRKNKSILNMARSILKTKKMPNKFWAEEVDYVVSLSNRCPMKDLNDITPQEA